MDNDRHLVQRRKERDLEGATMIDNRDWVDRLTKGKSLGDTGWRKVGRNWLVCRGKYKRRRYGGWLKGNQTKIIKGVNEAFEGVALEGFEGRNGQLRDEMVVRGQNRSRRTETVNGSARQTTGQAYRRSGVDFGTRDRDPCHAALARERFCGHTPYKPRASQANSSDPSNLHSLCGRVRSTIKEIFLLPFCQSSCLLVWKR